MTTVERKIIVIGSSMGGLTAIREVLSPLPHDFSFPIIIAQHFAKESGEYFTQYLKKQLHLQVNIVHKPVALQPGNIYLAPLNHHIRIQKTGVVEPYFGPKKYYARPSIDVLFKSAAEFYGSKVIAVILTGSNQDGAEGCSLIAANGGQVLIQNPLSAEAKQMPENSLKKVPNAIIFECNRVGGLLWDLAYQSNKRELGSCK